MDKNISNFITQKIVLWLIVSRLGLLSKYDYWLAEYSLIIPQKSITTSFFKFIIIVLYWININENNKKITSEAVVIEE